MQFFRQFIVLLIFAGSASTVFAQTQPTKKKPAAKKPTATKKTTTAVKKPSTPKPKAVATPTPVDPAVEKARFDEAIAAATPAEKAELLIKFIAEFPKSDSKVRVQESLAGARAAMADERLTAGDAEQAVKLFRLAIEEAPKPYSDRLFSGVIATVPANLYFRGQPQAALELAKLIESHSATNAKQLSTLATFYLGTENGAEAKRIAEAAVKLDETNPAAHQTLAMAHRLNFDLEESAKSYARALELNPESVAAKRSLAEMKRALGKADEAVALYRELLTKDEADIQARTGLILSLLETGKKSEAETDMAKSLESVPSNVVLLAGAAYWYAANNDGDKAVEYARRAIEKEPRYIWAHIALGRGLMLQKKPVEAEQALISARKYGNFPTLQYEIASARLAAGFFQDAKEELKRSFAVSDGSVKTRLGGRIERSAGTFTEVIAMERQASTFASSPADSAENAERLKALLELDEKLAAETPAEPEIVSIAERFAKGDDNMAVHRKLYAANLLLQKNIGADKAFELARSAAANIDNSLDVANPGAAVMASELYEARNVSFARDDFLLIPDVPKQTLSALMRGRVEEITGRALLRQGKAEEATIRFRRALSVFPKDSAWWRSATWNLGTALQAEGKDQEALDTMISSYKIDKPDVVRYMVIEALYRKVNGKTEGLEEKIGPNPMPTFTAASGPAIMTPAAEPQPTPAATPVEQTTTTPAEPKKEETQPTPSATPTEQVDPTSAEPVKEESKPVPSATPVEQPVPPTTEPKKDEPPASDQKTDPVDNKPKPSPDKIEESKEPEPKIETIVPKVDESESTPVETVPETKKPVESASKTTPQKEKLLFEPIVISIPKSGKVKPAETSAEKKNEENSDEDKASSEKVSDPAKPDESISSGASRPRVVEGKEITGGETPACTLNVSQDNISLINNGGSIAVLLSFDEKMEVTAVSSNPKDIEVRTEPDIADVKGRALFVIKSISANTGMFQVSFETSCGKKEILVRVR